MSNRIVKLPSVESFGHLTPDKWLLLKTLEELAQAMDDCLVHNQERGRL